jgi:hypothetical protein
MPVYWPAWTPPTTLAVVSSSFSLLHVGHEYRRVERERSGIGVNRGRDEADDGRRDGADRARAFVDFEHAYAVVIVGCHVRAFL